MCSVFFFCVLKTREKRWYDKKCGNSHVRSVFSRAYVTCEKRHPIWIFSPMRKSCRAQKVLTLLFFFSFETHNATRHRTEKRNTNEKKKTFVILYLLRALVLQRRRETREMPGNPPFPLTRLLLPCWQDVMLHLGTDSLRECQREILNRAGFPT